jgi:hypothetical protein
LWLRWSKIEDEDEYDYGNECEERELSAGTRISSSSNSGSAKNAAIVSVDPYSPGKKMPAQVVAMLTRLIDHFDTHDPLVRND